MNYLGRPVVWQRTDSRVFVYATRVGHTWWVLRLNDFPEHPLFTLFVDGNRIADVEDLKTTAPAWDLDVASRPPLSGEQRSEILTLMRDLGPYGSEIGQPCDGDWCCCAPYTYEHLQDPTPPRPPQELSPE